MYAVTALMEAPDDMNALRRVEQTSESEATGINIIIFSVNF